MSILIQPPENVAIAADRIANYTRLTPLMTSEVLNKCLGHELIFKIESLQKTGSFKVRGVLNSLLSLKEQNKLPEKISAYSTGNHGLALAWAAKKFGVNLNLYLPSFTAKMKQKIAQSYGANVILTKTRNEAEELALKEATRKNCILLPPSDYDDVIAGAGTTSFEVLKQDKNFDAIFVPCGGGGLASGTYLTTKLLSPKTKVFAGEPRQANDAAISFRTKKIFRFKESPETLADGARTLGITERIFNYITLLNDIYEISEREIAYWTMWTTHLLKVTSEPTSTLAVAAAHRWLSQQKDRKRVLIILTGGNIDNESYQMIWSKNYLYINPQDFIYDEE
jgi:threonine dehydratase